MDVIELNSSDVCHSLWAYSIIASVFSNFMFSSASETWDCYGSVLPHSTLLATLLWLGSYKYIRSCIQLLKMLHKCCKTDVFGFYWYIHTLPQVLCTLRSCIYVCMYVCMYVYMYISLGTLVPNSRDWHEKNGYRIFHTSKHTLK